MKKVIILIRGPICGGKSTIVELLKKNIHKASIVDMDSFKRSIDHAKASEWRDRMAFKTAIFLADEIMKKTGRVIIADIHSNKAYQYDAYKKLAKKNKYKLYSYLLYPPLKVCLERNRRRIIPDVKYKITKNAIKSYWCNPYKIKGEKIFDTSKIKPKEIAKSILNDLV